MANLATINNNLLADSGIDPLSVVLGTGTTNYLPKFTSSSAIGNSIFTELGGNTLRITAANAAIRLTGSNEYLLQTVDADGRFRIYDQTAANERVTLTSGGNVGIGTTNPSLKTHIVGTAGLPATTGTTQVGALRLQTGASTVSLDFGVNGGTGGWLQVTNANDLSLEYPLILNPNGGNVLIGTTVDDGGKLKVLTGAVGTVAQFRGAATDILNIDLDNDAVVFDSRNVSYTAFENQGSEKLRITSIGNVGIGTTNPIGTLDVANLTPSLYIRNTKDGSWTSGETVGALNFYTNDVSVIGAHIVSSITSIHDGVSTTTPAGALVFSTAIQGTTVTEAMRITSGGNVGIGTTSPTAILHVGTASTTGTTSMLLLSRASGYGHTLFEQTYDSTYFTSGKTLTLKNDAGTAFVHFAGNNAGTQTNLLIPAGNVGIGTTSPDGKLHVLNGSAGTVTANGNADELVVENSSTGGLSILTPDINTGYIIFGSPSDNEGAIIRYNQSGALMTIGTELAGGQLAFRTDSGLERMRIDSTGAATFSSSVTASSFVKSGGTAAQILAADGTVITAGTNITISGGSISAADIGFANPMTTLGDIIYGAASGAATRLAGNTTTTKQYLSQTGTGTASAAPSWSAIAGSDVTGAALTKTDDTNVTLTLGGTPATALLRAASLTLGWTGQLSVARGGTGASTAVAAFDNLSPLTTLGDTLFHNGTDNVRLAGNITTTKQFLSQTGTGTVSAAPAWATIAGSDITGAALTKTDDTNVTLTLGGTPATALLRAASITVGWTGTLAIGRGGTGLSALGTAGQLLRVNTGATALEYFTPTYLTAAITSLNGLTAATQTFATGTAGTDFNISSTTSTHTFNIPNASTANRGLVTTGVQTFGGAKTFDSFTTFNANLQGSGMYINATSTGVGTNALSQVAVLGAANTSVRNFTYLNSTTLTAGYNYVAFTIGTSAITEAASGTSALVSQLVLKPISLTNGAGSTTNGATLYIEGAAGGTATITNNYSVWVDDGSVRIDTLGGSGTRMVVADANGVMSTQAIPTTGISIGSSITSGTTGSVLFIGASSALTQNNSNFFWDDTNNRLGIGTANPEYSLHVKTGGLYPAQFTTTDYAFNTTGTNILFGFGASSGNTFGLINVGNSGGASGGKLKINTSGGYVGIGSADPDYLLTVGLIGSNAESNIQIATATSGIGSLYFGDTAGTGTGSYSGYIRYNHSVDAMLFGTSATEAFRISSTRAVLINTTTDDTINKLQVLGGASVTNLILGAGTTSIAPLEFNAGSLRTSVVEGDMEADTNLHLFYSHLSGVRGVVNAEQFLSNTGTYTLTSTTASQRIFNIGPSTAGAIIVKASTTYFFECMFSLTSMSGTSGNAQFNLLGAGTAGISSTAYTAWGVDTSSPTSAFATAGVFSNTVTSTALMPGSAGTGMWIQIKGIFRTNTTSGTVIPSIQLATAAAAIVGVNSYFRAYPIGSSSANYQGQ